MRLSTVVGSIQILVTGLIAGIFLAILATEPARLSLETTNFVGFQQGLHVIFARMLPPFAITAILAGIAWLILLRRQVRSAAFLLAALSTACAALAAILTFTLNFPLNDLLMSWNAASPPANVKELWVPWERDHMMRTVAYVVSFISAIAGNGLNQNER